MPRSEIVNNRPLSGFEAKQIILKQVEKSLDRDGMFQGHIAYSRMAFKVTVQLQLENPLYPNHVNITESKTPSKSETGPERLLVPPPIKDGDQAGVKVLGTEISGTINNPNMARLEHSLPITITRQDHKTGEFKDEGVVYDNTDVKPMEVEVKDVTKETEKEWGGKK